MHCCGGWECMREKKKRIVRELHVCVCVYCVRCAVVLWLFLCSVCMCGWFAFSLNFKIRFQAKLGNNWIVRTKNEAKVAKNKKSSQIVSHLLYTNEKSRNDIRVRASNHLFSHSFARSLTHLFSFNSFTAFECLCLSFSPTITRIKYTKQMDVFFLFASCKSKVAKIKWKKRRTEYKICMYSHPTTTLMQKNDQGEAHASEILNANK